VRKSSVLVSLLLLAPAGQAHADTPTVTSAVTAADVAKKDEKPRFLGFGMDFSIYDGTGLNGPAYANSINMYFEPNWAIGKRWLGGTRFSRLAIAGRFVLSRALAGYDESGFTGSAAQAPIGNCGGIQISGQGGQLEGIPNRCPTAGPNRWDYSDLWLTIKNPKIYTIPKVGIDLNPSMRVVFPTSLQSQYRTMLLSLTASLGLSRSFFHDKLTLSYSLGFTKFFYRNTAPGPLPTGTLPDGSVDGYSTSSIDGLANFYLDPSHSSSPDMLNPNFGLTNLFSVDYAPTDKLSFSLLYILFDNFAYGAQCGVQPYGNVMTDVCANANTVAMATNGVGTYGPAHKDTQVLWVTAGYQVLDWLNLSIAWINWAPLRKPDNSFRQGVISTNYDAFTTISFGATMSIEKAAAKVLPAKTAKTL